MTDEEWIAHCSPGLRLITNAKHLRLKSDDRMDTKSPLSRLPEMRTAARRTSPTTPKFQAVESHDATTTAVNRINRSRSALKAEGLKSSDDHSVPKDVYEITSVLGRAAPKGGWRNKAQFLEASKHLFGDADRAEQEECWKVYQRVTSDPRTPLIARSEVYKQLLIEGGKVSGMDAQSARRFSPAERSRMSPDELRSAAIIEQYQWLHTEHWSPVVNDFYILGIIHSKPNFAHAPLHPNDEVLERYRMNGGNDGRYAPTTTTNEVLQLEEFFDSSSLIE